MSGFILWFFELILSFLVELIGLTEQGKAFFFIDLIIGLISTYVIHCIFKKFYLPLFIYIISVTKKYSIILLLTFLATFLFNLDFFVAYQIILLGYYIPYEKRNHKDEKQKSPP